MEVYNFQMKSREEGINFFLNDFSKSHPSSVINNEYSLLKVINN